MTYVAGNRLLHGASSESGSQQVKSSNATQGGREPTRMKNHGESVRTNLENNSQPERVKGWRKLVGVALLAPLALTACAGGEAGAEQPPSDLKSRVEYVLGGGDATYEEVEALAKEVAGIMPDDPEWDEVSVDDQYKLYDIASKIVREGYEASIEHGEGLTKQFEIPAGLSDEELATTFVEHLNEWTNYGTTDELAPYLKNEAGIDGEKVHAITNEIAASNADAIAAALFVPERENSDGTNRITEYISNFTSGNEVALFTSYLAKGEEKYKVWREVQSIEAVSKPLGLIASEDTRFLQVHMTQHANTDKNDSLEYFDEGVTTLTPEGKPFRMTVGFAEVDGTARVASLGIGATD